MAGDSSQAAGKIRSWWGGADMAHGNVPASAPTTRPTRGGETVSTTPAQQILPKTMLARSVRLSRGVHGKPMLPRTQAALAGARPAGDLLAMRRDIWEGVSRYSRARREGAHRPGTDDKAAPVDGQLAAGSIVIADMHAEIAALEEKLERNRRAHAENMAREAKRTWSLELKARRQEKINRFLRRVATTGRLEAEVEGDEICHRAVNHPDTGPAPGNALLLQSIQACSQDTGNEFVRIIPPNPDPISVPLSTTLPVSVWVKLVNNYDDIYREYTFGSRRTARRALDEAREYDDPIAVDSVLLTLRDQDIDDTRCTLDLIKVLLSNRHIGRLRQLGLQGEKLVIIKDDASIRDFTDPVYLEELLRHGDKKLPLLVALPPPGVNLPRTSTYAVNQMSQKAARGPLVFQENVMTAEYQKSVKSMSSAASAAQELRRSETHGNSQSSLATRRTSLSWTTNPRSSAMTLNTTTAARSSSMLSGNPVGSASSQCGKQAGGLESHAQTGHSHAGSFLTAFQNLLTSHNDLRRETTGLGDLAIRSELEKRRMLVHRSVEKLLAGFPAEDEFRVAVDALDKKARADTLAQVASEFSVLALFNRTLRSISKLNESGLDLVGCCDLFQQEVKALLQAQYVRLWMVDQENSQIWEWVGQEKHPRKRSFQPAQDTIDLANVTKRKLEKKAGIAAGVARSGIAVNVPFPAVQCPSFSIEIDRLPGENALTILCEPIRHRGEVIAVVQCYNKQRANPDAMMMHDQDARESFTIVDEHVMRMLCHNMAELIHKCNQYRDMMTGPNRTLHYTGLTWHYPCSPGDLFELGQNYLFDIQNMLQAEHCVFYVISTNAISGAKSMWAGCPHGLRTRRYAEIGQGLAGWVAEHEMPLNVSDCSKDARFDKTVDAAFTDPEQKEGDPSAGLVARSALAVPLKNQDGSMLGVVVMLNSNKTDEGNFSAFDESLLKLECEHVVLMVKSCTASFTYFRHEETIAETLYRCMHLAECERTHLFLTETVQRKGKDIRQLSLFASSNDYIDRGKKATHTTSPVQVPLSDGLLGYVVRTGREIIIPDARGDPRFNVKLDDTMGCRTSSLMVIPVKHEKDQSKPVGVLLVANKHGASAFSRMDTRICAVFSRLISKLYSKLSTESLDSPAKDG